MQKMNGSVDSHLVLCHRNLSSLFQGKFREDYAPNLATTDEIFQKFGHNI